VRKTEFYIHLIDRAGDDVAIQEIQSF